MTVNLIILLFSIAIFCIQLARTRYGRGLAAIPGPFIASFSNIWKITAVYKKDMPQRNIAIHEKYGPVVRIGPYHVSCASPEALHIIHGSRQAFPKSDFYKPTTPVLDDVPLYNLFSIQDVNYHSTLKKNTANLYSKTAIREFESKVDICTMLFVSKFSEIAKYDNKRVDMALWLHLYAFDSLAQINVSKNFGFIERGTDVNGMISATGRILHMTALYGQAPFLQRVQAFVKYVWSVKTTNPILMYSISQVEERRKTSQPATDMLGSLLKAHEAQPDKLSIKEITGAVYINLIAGHDVLAITLRAIFYYLARSPRVMTKLRDEIASLDNSYTLSEPLPYSEVTNFTYLDAVINEALRIHANTGLMLERVVPPEGTIIDGYTIPGGTIVGVNAWVIHRNTEIFGEDALEFRPERWLEASEKRVIEMKRNLFSFGAGPRGCIGRNMAMLQMTKLVVEFYRRFDARLADPEKEWAVHGSWMTSQTDMDMVITPL